MSVARLWARTTRGLEGVVVVEAVQRWGCRPVRVGPRDVLLESDVECDAAAFGLRTADDVFWLAAELAGIGERRQDLVSLRQALLNGAGRLTAVHRRLSPARRSLPISVSASARGRQNFTHFDLADAVGKALGQRLGVPYIPGRVAGQHLEVNRWRVQFDGGRVLVGLRPGLTPLHRRPWKRDSLAGSLHPPVAAAMSLVALTSAPGGRIADPTCGAGTIAIEAARWTTAPTVIALDASIDAARATAANARRAGVSIGLMTADAQHLPLAQGSIDAVVANPPWGKQVPAWTLTLDHLLAEADRVCTPNGRVILLAPQHQLDGPVSRSPWRLAAVQPLALHGQRTAITILDRGSPTTSVESLVFDALRSVG